MKTGNFELGGEERVTCHRSNFTRNSDFSSPRSSTFHIEDVVETEHQSENVFELGGIRISFLPCLTEDSVDGFVHVSCRLHAFHAGIER